MTAGQGRRQEWTRAVSGIPITSQSNLGDRHARLLPVAATGSLCPVLAGRLRGLVANLGIAAMVEETAVEMMVAPLEDRVTIGVAVAEEDQCVEDPGMDREMGQGTGRGMDREMVHQDDLAMTDETRVVTIEGQLGSEEVMPQRCRRATGTRGHDVSGAGPTARQCWYKMRARETKRNQGVIGARPADFSLLA